MKTKAGLEIAADTDPGCLRANNEDSFSVDEELGLLVVADGMGGHNSGEVASGLATQSIRDFARRLLAGGQLVSRQLEECVKSANTLIYEKGRAFPKDAGMGTTVVAAVADGQRLVVAHVGDSRLYVFRGGRLELLTEDHSLVGEQQRRGLITAEEAAKSNLQNILTRALGAEAEVEVDVADHPLLPGDVVLLATDGLTKMVSDERIAAAAAAAETPSSLVADLIRLAREGGGVDNITVVAARVPRKGEAAGIQRLVSRIFGR